MVVHNLVLQTWGIGTFPSITRRIEAQGEQGFYRSTPLFDAEGVLLGLRPNAGGKVHAHPPRWTLERDRSAAAQPVLPSEAPHGPPQAWPLVHLHERQHFPRARPSCPQRGPQDSGFTRRKRGAPLRGILLGNGLTCSSPRKKQAFCPSQGLDATTRGHGILGAHAAPSRPLDLVDVPLVDAQIHGTHERRDGITCSRVRIVFCCGRCPDGGANGGVAAAHVAFRKSIASGARARALHQGLVTYHTSINRTRIRRNHSRKNVPSHTQWPNESSPSDDNPTIPRFSLACKYSAVI